MSEPIHHLPKQIDESADKNHFYETLWKRVGLELLIKHAGTCAGMTRLDYGCGSGPFIRVDPGDPGQFVILPEPALGSGQLRVQLLVGRVNATRKVALA